MLMNFSSKKKAVHATPVMFPGRTGHRAARINDSIFVVGGTDKCGKLVSEVHRINCLTNRIDCIILENSLTLQGFSLFCHQDSLFIWGGLHLRQHMNQLLQFDGSKFIPVKQNGQVPKSRAYHTSTIFGGKFLILFAGSDGHSFFNDWNLLNLKTMEWQSLTPSMEIKFNLGCSMVWANGRGILLVNQLFDEFSNSIISNSFYQFYVSDYNRGLLTILPLDITTSNPIFQEYIFNHMTVSDHNSILIFGGYRLNANTELHSLSYILTLDQLKLEKAKFRYKEKSQFESICHRNKLYIIGGILSKSEMEECVDIHEMGGEKTHYKRHVCSSCKLYFDEQWHKTSRQVYPNCRIRQEYDYNYHMRIDNRILAKFSTFITNDLYALTLILQSLKTLTAKEIEVSFRKHKDNYSLLIPEMTDETYHYLKVSSSFQNVDPNVVVNQLIMLRERDCEDCLLDADVVQLAVLRLKIASYRLGRSCLISIRTSKDEVCIIYFSCNQIQCTYSNFNPFNNSHYYYNLQTKVASSRNDRHVVFENVKHVLKSAAEYEELAEGTISMIIFCGDEIESELASTDQNWDAQTGQTCSFNPLGKDENRKMMPLLQFSFLPTAKHCNIFIDHARITFINILDLLIGDMNGKILERIDNLSKAEDIIERAQLFYYPSQYWLRRLLIYHSNRLIMHFQETALNICGVIILRQTVELDLTGNRMAQVAQEARLRETLRELRGTKRSVSF